MLESPKREATKLTDGFRNIVDNSYVFNLVPPLLLCSASIVFFAFVFHEEFNFLLVVVSAITAIAHGVTVCFAYRVSEAKKTVQVINFVACLLYLALLTTGFGIYPESERGRGIALLLFGASLAFSSKRVYLAFAACCVTTLICAFYSFEIPLTGRDLFYACLIPAVLGYCACHSRGTVLDNLNSLLVEAGVGSKRASAAGLESQSEQEKRPDSDSRRLGGRRGIDRLMRVLPQVHWVRQDNLITFISPSYEQVWESRCEELYADQDAFLTKVHPEDRDALLAAMADCSTTGHFDHQYRLLMDDGRTKWIHARGYVDPEEPSLEFGVAEEITTRRETEQQFRNRIGQLEARVAELETESDATIEAPSDNALLSAEPSPARQLESLGLLAGGLAHDFNNLLMAVLINVDLIQMDLKRGKVPDEERVADIEKASLRAAEVCSQMLQFSGKAPSEMHKVDLNSLISDCEQTMRATLRDGIELKFEVPVEPCWVQGGAEQIQQVLFNLITNSIEAVGQSGEIDVTLSTDSLSNMNLENAYIDLGITSGRFHVISFRDDGEGIDPAEWKRLFEPRFSSRNPGKGLGLSTVLGIVKGHRGTILVDSQPGGGTEFRVLLPVQEEKEEASRSETSVSVV
ncbi:MAG: ATP-binding protein [Planctomycetota bacterium]|nr:ATP-binding protein [Planctomycetota bacterium]